jgi:hypothetical protein
MAVELSRLATALLEKETDPEKRWKRLCEVHRELSQLRRDDHRAVRTLIERLNWIRQTEREDREEDKRREQEHSARRCAPFWAQLELGPLAEAFGGGQLGRDIAAHILEVQKGLPVGTLGGKSVVEQSTAPSVGPNPSESDLIRLEFGIRLGGRKKGGELAERGRGILFLPIRERGLHCGGSI